MNIGTAELIEQLELQPHPEGLYPLDLPGK